MECGDLSPLWQERGARGLVLRSWSDSRLAFEDLVRYHLLMAAKETNWPHAPRHQLAEAGTYFVTVGTYEKLHHFRKPNRLDVLQRGLLNLTAKAGWQVEAWAVFSNHYHFVAHSPQEGAESLSAITKELHARTSKWINRLDSAVGRKVWHNYRETQLTYERAYLARLKYVHHNAVHHGLVRVANHYPWCSAPWFENIATSAQVRTIYEMRTDRVNVVDPWVPEVADWFPVSERDS